MTVPTSGFGKLYAHGKTNKQLFGDKPTQPERTRHNT